jgi:hypothetical protein
MGSGGSVSILVAHVGPHGRDFGFVGGFHAYMSGPIGAVGCPDGSVPGTWL